jgi:hypothetical protein
MLGPRIMKLIYSIIKHQGRQADENPFFYRK